jgi:hypothetical protein
MGETAFRSLRGSGRETARESSRSPGHLLRTYLGEDSERAPGSATTSSDPLSNLTTMKLCRRCGRWKALGEFHRRAAGRQSWCKACRKEYDAAYFQAARTRLMARKRERRREVVRWHRELKESQPCADCGGFFHHAAMSWDHLPGSEKISEVSHLTRFSRKAVLAEIAKCELVCLNCHAVRSYMRRGA